MRIHSALVLLSGLVACSHQDPAPPPAPIVCSTESHPASTCTTDFASTPGTPFPASLDHHATALFTSSSGSFLYVVGGNNYRTILSTVYVAAILADGTLGPWIATTPLPEGRAGHGIAVAHGRLIVVSGQNGTNTYPANVTSAPILADGMLGPWSEEPSLPVGRFHAYVATSDTDLYVTGGVERDNMKSSTAVYRAPLHANGTLGDFVVEHDLPIGRSHHVAMVHAGRLFIVAGHTGDASVQTMLPEVLSAPIGADGTLGEFENGGQLEGLRDTPSWFENDGQLYLLGGIAEDGSYLADAVTASFSEGSQLGSFSVLRGRLSAGRAHVHQTPLWNGRFYSVGGSTSMGHATPTVEIGLLTYAPRALARVVAPAHGSPGPRKSLASHCNASRDPRTVSETP